MMVVVGGVWGVDVGVDVVVGGCCDGWDCCRRGLLCIVCGIGEGGNC